MARHIGRAHGAGDHETLKLVAASYVSSADRENAHRYA